MAAVGPAPGHGALSEIAFWHACRQRPLDVMRMFLDGGGDAETVKNDIRHMFLHDTWLLAEDRRYVLTEVIKSDDIEFVHELLRHGEDPALLLSIIDARQQLTPAMLRLFFDFGLTEFRRGSVNAPLGEVFEFGWMMLNYCCPYPSDPRPEEIRSLEARDLLDLIFEYGISTEERVCWGDTTLMTAVREGHTVDTVKHLLLRGADIHARPRTTIIDLGSGVSGGKILKDSTPLHLAMIHTIPGVVKALLDAGADVNLANCHGMTPLMALCWYIVYPGSQDPRGYLYPENDFSSYRVTCLQLLLDAGADTKAVNEEGLTALAILQRAGNVESVHNGVFMEILKNHS